MLMRVVVELHVLHAVREVLLLDPVAGVVVRVLVADAAVQLAAGLVVGVLQVGWDREVAGVLDLLHGLEDRGGAGVRLRCRGDVGRGLGQDDLGFRHADTFHSQESVGRNHRCHGVCIAHVLRGADHDAAGDELDVLARGEHAGQVVNGGVRVGAAHGLDEGAHGVVVVIAVLVVTHGALLDALGGDVDGDVNAAVRVTVGGENRELDGIERRAGVAVCSIREEFTCVVVDPGVEGADAFPRVREGTVDEGRDVLAGERLQLEDAGAGDQRAVDLEVRVLGGRADEDHGAVLDEREEVVLLRLVEAVDLVDEEDGLPAVAAVVLLRAGDDLLEVLLSGDGRVHLLEVGLRGVRDDLREGRLAGARRAVKDEGAELVGPDRAVEQGARGDDLLLADDFVEGLRAHAGGQRRVGLLLLLRHIFK